MCVGQLCAEPRRRPCEESRWNGAVSRAQPVVLDQAGDRCGPMAGGAAWHRLYLAATRPVAVRRDFRVGGRHEHFHGARHAAGLPGVRGPDDLRPVRSFILGWFRGHIQAMVLTIAAGQAIIAVLLARHLIHRTPEPSG